jgi:hypothetical protein
MTVLSGSDNYSEFDVERLEEQAAALTEEFRTLMKEVREYDDELAALLRAIDDDAPTLSPLLSDPNYDQKTADWLLDLHGDMLEKIESGEATPEEINDWWNKFGDDDQELIANEFPELIGPLDGIPTEHRDISNRVLLQNEIDSFPPNLDGQIADLEALLASMDEGTYTGPGEIPYDGTTMDREALEEHLAGLYEQRDDYNALVALQDRIAEPHVFENGESVDYFLLGIDSAEDGKAIVAVGNPDTADNVNVYVPGTGADLGSVGGGGEWGHGDIGRAEKSVEDAMAVAPGESTAAIMWLDYDAPDNVIPFVDGGAESQASSESYAQAAASDLSSFTDGLRATDQGGGANLTMTGHSYGSTTIGVAARDEGLDVDNMIFVGSPGVGVESAEDLGIPPENVWASRNEEDVIEWAADEASNGAAAAAATSGGGPLIAAAAGGLAYWLTPDEDMIHGTDPYAEEFGGNTFTSDATRDSAMGNHSAYWDDGNASRKNMAYIITGETGRVT